MCGDTKEREHCSQHPRPPQVDHRLTPPHTCASTRRHSSLRPSASCRMPLVVKSNAALVPPVESTQLTVRWRWPS
jgi:hypothetical protein